MTTRRELLGRSGAAFVANALPASAETAAVDKPHTPGDGETFIV